jgi:hypothetical protein
MTINLLSVLGAGVLAMVIGALWYSPLLFAKAWSRESGMTDEKIKAVMKKGMGKTYFGSFLAALLLSFVLDLALGFVARGSGQPLSFMLGVQVGAWIWLGFITTSFLNPVFWEGKSWKLYWINVGHYFVLFTLVGGLLGLLN